MNAIEIKNVSKFFKITHGREETLKGFVTKIFQGRQYFTEEFWALKNVTFNVKRGESLGIIGSNGSGKTTLLRMLAKIIFPDSGTIRVNGKISTLFELGTGFHPELSGRENIYLNGSILGLTKREVDKKFSEIVAFSELGDFIDTPLKFYSAGMQVRLAFAVAISVNPEVLLVDEVLAVGDASFQEKSFSKFQEFKKKQATIVFISHDLGRIQEFCDRVVVMRKGSPYFIGDPEKGVLEYLRLNMAEEEKNTKTKVFKGKSEDKIFRVTDIQYLNKEKKEKKKFETGEKLIIRIHYFAKKRIENPVIGIALHRDDGVHLTGPNTKDSKFIVAFAKGRGYIDYELDKIPLHAGSYLLTVGLFDSNVSFAYDFIDKGSSFKVGLTEINQAGIFKFDGKWNWLNYEK